MTRSENLKLLAKMVALSAALSAMILLAYSNTFHSSWHLDDRPNILDNQGLHISDLNAESLIRTFYTSPQRGGAIGKQLYRPVACLTFALNWYFGGNDVFGYHLVNIVIHLFTAWLLFLTILQLLKTPNLAGKYDRREYPIAFIATVLWALNPIHTQAVTYIVQRMASMAALFYILSLFLYIQFRISHKSAARVCYLLGCVLAYALALGSKENSITLPIALFLIEVAFFQDLSSSRMRRIILLSLVGGLLTLIAIGFYIAFSWDSSSIGRLYKNRPFSLTERLLTEPRVILFYLSLLFYPVPNRLSIDHDITLSITFFQPWTTLPALLIVLLLVGLGISQIRKRPLVFLAILFFFLNHLIESTIIPLELIFEHRNYLPSQLIFVPVALGIFWCFDYGSGNRVLNRVIWAGFVALLIGILGWSTYIRNAAWASERSLWEDAMQKAPNSARPHLVMAWDLAYGENERSENYDKALELYTKALPLKRTLNTSPAFIYNNIAGIYAKKQEYQTAIAFYEKALKMEPDDTRARFNLVNILVFLGKFSEASIHTDILISKNKNNWAYLNIKGLLLLRQEKSQEAIYYLQQALKANPGNNQIRLKLGVAQSLVGEFKDAEKLLQQTDFKSVDNITTLFCLIENSMRAGDLESSSNYAGELLSAYDADSILAYLHNQLQDNFQVPLKEDLIASAIEDRMSLVREK
jgi:tetratricopeptide (TPR) repeat protein